jgi:hypothetical protein
MVIEDKKATFTNNRFLNVLKKIVEPDQYFENLKLFRQIDPEEN